VDTGTLNGHEGSIPFTRSIEYLRQHRHFAADRVMVIVSFKICTLIVVDPKKVTRTALQKEHNTELTE